MNSDGWFNIRIYGLIVSDDQKNILISDEFQLDQEMTKFPGGGLQYGEGTTDCLRREFQEECNQELDRIEHFYTTDFFQQALFFDNCQLISIYYKATLKKPIRIPVSEKPFDFPEMKNGSQSFRWVPIKTLNPDDFTFPIDKHVAHLLKQS